MRKFLTSLTCCLMIAGIAGCSNNSKSDLIKKFKDDEQSIKELSDNEADVFLKYVEESKDLTFNEIAEKIILNSDDDSNDSSRIIDEMKSEYTLSDAMFIGGFEVDEKKYNALTYNITSSKNNEIILFLLDFSNQNLYGIVRIMPASTDSDISFSYLQMIKTITLVDSSLSDNIEEVMNIASESFDGEVNYGDWKYKTVIDEEKANLIFVAFKN